MRLAVFTERRLPGVILLAMIWIPAAIVLVLTPVGLWVMALAVRAGVRRPG